MFLRAHAVRHRDAIVAGQATRRLEEVKVGDGSSPYGLGRCLETHGLWTGKDEGSSRVDRAPLLGVQGKVLR
ncbi:hypothetical protein GN956_G26264 [Arapaima gigas]